MKSVNASRLAPGVFLVLGLSLILLQAGCTGAVEPGVAGDPSGTVTTTLRIPSQGANSIRFATGSTSTTGGYDLYIDQNLNFQGRIAGVGAVSGLGRITTVPSSGFVVTTSATTGNGYVVRSSDGLNLFYAVYVARDIVSSASGGVIGKELKWVALTRLQSIAVTPAGSTVIRPASTGSCVWINTQFTAMGTNSDGSINDITSGVAWSISPEPNRYQGNTPSPGSLGTYFVGSPYFGRGQALAAAGSGNPCAVSTIAGTSTITATSAVGVAGSTTLTIQ